LATPPPPARGPPGRGGGGLSQGYLQSETAASVAPLVLQTAAR
jgi:hypothetical protein